MPANNIDIKVTADTADAEKGLDRVGKSGKSMSEKLGSAGRKMTLGVTVPLAAAGVAAFKMASDLGEATSQAEQVFGDGAAGIIDAAQNMEDSFSEAEFLSFASTFGDIAQGLGFAKDEADDLSIGVLGLAQDLGSFKNLPTEQAVQAITAAMTGEREALKSLGIVIDEEMVKARAMADRADGVTGALTRQEKATATLALITEGSVNAIGDFDRTADGAANKTRIMTANFKDTAATLGENLLPIGMQLLDWANKIATAFGELSPTMQKVVLIGGALLAALGPVLSVGSKMVTMYGHLKTAMMKANAMGLAQKSAFGALGGVLAVTAGAMFLMSKKANRSGLDLGALSREMVDAAGTADDYAGAINGVTGELTDMASGLITTAIEEIGHELSNAFTMAGITGQDLVDTIDDLALTMNSGDVGQFQKDWEALLDVLGLDAADEQARALHRLIVNMGLAREKAGRLASTQGELADEVETTTEEVDNLEEAWSDLTSTLLDSENSHINAAQLLEDIVEAGEGINDMSYAESRREIDSLATEYARVIGDMVDEGKSIEEIEDFANTARFGMLNLMIQSGHSADEIDRVVDVLDEVDGKAVTATVTTNFVTRGSPGKPSIFPAGAEGAIVRQPTVALIGEAGPEALVPLNRTPGASPLPSLGSGGPQMLTVQVVMPDGRVLAEAVAEANLDSGGQFG